ncbi:MAG: hypothetical protein QME32_02950 [Endomicrobiia bacterium]|nr:hypothetical protein [Endomicrobiia bacterium]
MDYYGLFKRINELGVGYIVVGGLAVNLHGIPRLTYDVDMLVEMSDENLNKLLGFLKEMGYKPKAPVDILDFADPVKRNDWIANKNIKAFCLVSDKAPVREIDLIIGAPVDYASAKNNIVFYDLYDTKIATIGIDDLIKMKKAAARKQDDSDIEHLKRVR